MKKYFLFQMILAMILMYSSAICSASGCESFKTDLINYALPCLSDETTITVTIVKIDLSTNTVTLKDKSGKLYEFKVDPKLIDLSKVKVGQTVTATISTTVITDKETRAKISKTQLMKLQ